MRLILVFMLFAVNVRAQNVMPAIGAWREHLPYQHAADVTATETKIVCATPYSLFTVDKVTKEVVRMSKVSGLSETGVSTVMYDEQSKKLYVAYANSNIDVLQEGSIRNIPDIMRTTISGDKTIYHIFPDNTWCYLSTGLGVIVLDAVKYEVKDSWFIGNNGGYVKTHQFTKSGNFFYAATDEGLKRTPVNTSNPADFRNWQILSGANGLSNSPCKGVVTWQNRVVALQNDTLFVDNNGNWSVLYANGWTTNSINVSENKLLVSQLGPNGTAQVIVLNTGGTVERVLQQPGYIAFPENAISVNGEYWVADLYGGLTHWAGSSFTSYRLDSPFDVGSGEIVIRDNKLYATGGSVNFAWNYQYNRSGLFKMQEGSWTNYNRFTHPALDTMLDFISVAIDPRDGSAWTGSFGGGLLHLKYNNQAEVFKQNSPIGATVGDPGSYRVAGLAFDADENLWVSNFGSPRQLHVLRNNGTWQSFTAPFTLTENAVAQIVIDDAGQKWITSPLGNGLIVFDEGDFDTPNDDRWRLFRAGTSNGNLPTNEVISLAKDRNGFIWIGTSDGIAVVQCPEAVFSQGSCAAIWPVIMEGAFANYLFKGEEVRSIAVDGANRKWIATSSGAWLVAPDGDKVLAQFTEVNSPLLSSDVRKIAINGATGEVFFVTAKGISSFRGAATEAEETKNKVLVFPNPVQQGFSGTIGIRGLPDNSFVKITETSGRLVYQSRSLGGQAVWNGRDYKGNKVATGVYLVIAVDELKQEKVVGKIVFIR